MKILAFLQNQWFKNPAAVKAMLDRHPDKRNEIIKRLLFAGCLSSKRLRAAFGDLCDRIIWEESSREMADHAGGVFKADTEHIRQAINMHAPEMKHLESRN